MVLTVVYCDLWSTDRDQEHEYSFKVHDMNFLQCESSTAGSVSTAQNHNRPSHIDTFHYSALVKSKKVYNEFSFTVHGSCLFC
jgi:hypothetical protein